MGTDFSGVGTGRTDYVNPLGLTGGKEEMVYEGSSFYEKMEISTAVADRCSCLLMALGFFD